MNIAIIGSHFDDIELSMGGTLYLLTKNKHNVIAIITSQSDYSDYSGVILRTKEQAIKEGMRALHYLGVKIIYCLNFPTKDVPCNSDIIEKINWILDKNKIDIIYTHSLDDKHPSHYNTSKATIAAARYYKNIIMYEPLHPSNLHISFQPLLYVNISESFNAKINSLKLHKSQYRKYTNWKDLIHSLARLRGIELGVKYAEAFQPLKMEYKI
jgi:LmbE family N-acetylglucosaminyl deacetylase